METPHESDRPAPGGGGKAPEDNPGAPGAAPDQEPITPDRLTQLIGRLESGFYDAPEVREHIARRIREELDP